MITTEAKDRNQKPNLGDCIDGEVIIHRNTVNLHKEGLKVIFAATDSKKVIITVQSIKYPENFTTYTKLDQLNSEFWTHKTSAIKKAFKKMAKRYRQHYSDKPEHQPIENLDNFELGRLANQGNKKALIELNNRGIQPHTPLALANTMRAIHTANNLQFKKEPVNYHLQLWAYLSQCQVIFVEVARDIKLWALKHYTSNQSTSLMRNNASEIFNATNRFLDVIYDNFGIHYGYNLARNRRESRHSNRLRLFNPFYFDSWEDSILVNKFQSMLSN
jgi:hypothetical protein